MRHLIDFGDLTRAEWESLYQRCSDIMDHPADFMDACRGRVMASLFYEPSTRTNFSFQTAMLRVGGTVFGFADPKSTSTAKGETLKDTIKMVSGYADVVVMRNPKEGAAKAASLLSEQLRSRTFGKEYLAVVHGVPEGGVMTDLLGRDPVRRRTYVAAEPGKNVRPAELSYEVLGSREGLSLVRIRLHTGRTHQIRVQFASRGFPLVGDRKYGGGEEGESIALWSWRLEFTHPQTGAAMRFSKLPPKETPWLGFPMPLTGR